MKKDKKKFRTSEESRKRALSILAKNGHLPNCKNCDKPDDRKRENCLCTACHIKEQKEIQAEEEYARRVEEQREKYQGRAGQW